MLNVLFSATMLSAVSVAAENWALVFSLFCIQLYGHSSVNVFSSCLVFFVVTKQIWNRWGIISHQFLFFWLVIPGSLYKNTRSICYGSTIIVSPDHAFAKYLHALGAPGMSRVIPYITKGCIKISAEYQKIGLLNSYHMHFILYHIMYAFSLTTI